MRQEVITGLAVWLILLITFAIYSAGFDGIFLLDDVRNLKLLNQFNEQGVHDLDTLKAFVFNNNSGVLGRPVSMITFLIDDIAYPGDPGTYRYTNTLFHLLCVIAVFVFTRLLLINLCLPKNHADTLGLIITLWWSILPIHVSTTLYIVQRMTILSAIFLLSGMVCYLVGRIKLEDSKFKGWLYIGFGTTGFAGLAILSKENGILIFPLLLLIEFILNKKRPLSDSFKLKSLFAVPTFLFIFYLIYQFPSFLNNYIYRDFTLKERVLTESRILGEYFLQILLPRLAEMGLYHDDIKVSRNLFTPLTTILTLAFHILLLVSAYIYRRKYYFVFLGIFWYYISHTLESSIIPLELYFEHRNYLPSIGLIFALTLYIYTHVKYVRITAPILIILFCFYTLGLYQRVNLWGSSGNLFSVWAHEKPNSYRAQMSYVTFLLVNKEIDAAFSHLKHINEKWPEKAGAYIAIKNQECIRFGNSNENLIDLSKVDFKNLEYSDDLGGSVQNLMDSFRTQRCSFINNQSMIEILEKVVLVQKSNNVYKAQIYLLLSEIYTAAGNLNKTIESLDKAFELHRDSYFQYKKSLLLHSAGLREQALEAALKAKAVELESPKYKQINNKLYDRLIKNLNQEPSI